MSLLQLFSSALLTLMCFAATGEESNPEDPFPQGDTPAPIVSHHFPDRVHEFVWRNWNAVEPEKLARILQTSRECDRERFQWGSRPHRWYRLRCRRDMPRLSGALAPAPHVQRRNWSNDPGTPGFHTGKRIFWIKLGRLKPLEALRIVPTRRETRRRKREMLETEFGAALVSRRTS